MLDKIRNKAKQTLYSFVINGFDDSAQRGKTCEMSQLFNSASENEKLHILSNAVKKGTFAEVCAKGHYDTLVYLYSLLNDVQRNAVFEDNKFAPFRYSVSKGHKDVVEKLLSYATPEQKVKMLTLEVDGIAMWPFIYSVKKCRTKLVKVLLKADDSLKPVMIEHNGMEENPYWAFRYACKQGQSDMAETLHKYASFVQKPEMIAQNGGLGPYSPFILACQDRQWRATETIYNLATYTARKAMVAAWSEHKTTFGLNNPENNDEQTNLMLSAIDAHIESLVHQDAIINNAKYISLAKEGSASNVVDAHEPSDSIEPLSISILMNSFLAASKDGRIGDMAKLYWSVDSEKDRSAIQQNCLDKNLFIEAVIAENITTARYIYTIVDVNMKQTLIQQLDDFANEKGKSTMNIDDVGKSTGPATLNIPELIQSLKDMKDYQEENDECSSEFSAKNSQEIIEVQ